jgi:glycosyltransferase involved in cell wall biosynthesis
MKVVVATTIMPFVRGGARILVDGLSQALADQGHQVDELLLPFWDDPEEMVEQMLALRLLDVSHEADLLICLRTPSYLLQHPNKVVWFLHHHRPAYDLADSPFSTRTRASERRVRDAIHESDRLGLDEARRVFAISQTVADRLRSYNGLECDVLYPPLEGLDGYRCDDYGDVVFLPSRIAPVKRQALAIEAMAHVRSPVRIVVVGAPDLPEHVEPLRELVHRLALGDRVELVTEWVPEERKRDLYARCLAVVFPPYGEDGYGYVAGEAFASAKAVVTCTDSGGPLELVEDGLNGRVVEPEPEALAAAIDDLARDRSEARRLGEAGRASLRKLGFGWDRVVAELTR